MGYGAWSACTLTRIHGEHITHCDFVEHKLLSIYIQSTISELGSNERVTFVATSNTIDQGSQRD